MDHKFNVEFLEDAMRFWTKHKQKEKLVICTHGIVKKTNKTPQKEIDKAEQCRIEYLKINRYEN
ncbi:MAG: type II toxin-antitoxin system RelE/ParE family toxin [Bacteroidia bacterium]|nr:type II toxin-antitoxin system RelE/ParE family toxin [Bacteroidia bacterium]